MKANLPPWPEDAPIERMIWASDAQRYVPESEAEWSELAQAYVLRGDTTRDRREAVREDAWPEL